MSLLKNSIVVGLGTLTSRFLGLARDVMLAKVLGAGVMSDAFLMALKTPNLVRNLLSEGALNVSVVPMLTRHMDGKTPTPAAEKFVNSVFSILVVALVVAAVLGVIFMPALITLIAPGFTQDPARFEAAVTIGRVMFPYVLFIILANYIGCVLNTMGKFAAMALMPALLNISFLVFLYFSHGLTNPAYFIAWAVPVGGVLQLGLMWWLIRRTGFKLELKRPHHHPDMPVLAKRVGPATMTVGVQLLNGMVDSIFASLLAAGAVSYLFYAERFYLLPVALIGIAVSTALLPDLSRVLQKGDTKDTAKQFSGALVACFALGLAAALGLFSLAEPIMHLVYARGAFTPADADQTAYTLMAYAIGLPAVIATKITLTAFFAHGDTKTPMRFAIYALLANVVLNAVLMGPYKHVGLALATSTVAWLILILQLRSIQKRELFPAWKLRDTLHQSVKALGVGLVMLVVLALWQLLWPLPESRLVQMVWLGGVIGLSAGVFLSGLQLLGLFDLKPLVQKVLARVKK
jgi:putative peptidoglycan lipid II flippase